MAEHRQEFQRQLEAIEARVIELFAMVGADLPGATNALLTGSNEMAGLLAEREKTIGALYPELEELVNKEILLQAPVASDLRFLLAVSRIVPEIELSHNLVVQIAARADHYLSADLSPRCRGLTETMGNLVADMWRGAVDAWYQRDGSAAAVLSRTQRRTRRAAVQHDRRAGLGPDDPAGDDGDDAGGRFYQRLGDHAVNIARRVVYLAGSQPPQRPD